MLGMVITAADEKKEADKAENTKPFHFPVRLTNTNKLSSGLSRAD